MEILSYNCSPSCHVVNLWWKSVRKSSNSCQSKLPSIREHRFSCNNTEVRSGFSGYSNINQFPSTNLDRGKGSRSLNSLQGFRNLNSQVSSANYDGYVIGGEEDAGIIPKEGEAIPKALIPGLPEESNGECGAKISSCFWEWKPKFNVHYEKAGCENVNSPPVLFLPGFGVGSFHYEKQLRDLGRDYRVWAIDFLGQGMSLPLEDPTLRLKEGGSTEGKDSLWGFGDKAEPWASELVYSVDLWRNQVCYFIQEVIREPVYLVGNSLGGFVAVYFAAYNPELVKGVTLLNATPFWGFSPNPIRSPRLAKIFPRSGKFPLPASVRKLIEFL